MFSCFCLNIIIESATDDFEKVTPESLNLSGEEKNDSFFQQDIRQVKNLKNIKKVQASLVQARNIGHWTVNSCINCICEAYAVHREKGASCVVINSKLRDYESEQIKRKEDISKVFNIIVDTNGTEEWGNLLESYRLCDAEAIIRNVKETMSEFLRKESLAVEERIKKYSEEQYEILNSLGDAAYEERDSLVRLVQSLTDQTKPECTKISMAASEVMDSSPKSFTLNENLFMKPNEKLQPPRHTPKRQKSSPAAPVSSFDAEGLFDFEGSDGIGSQTESDAAESDKEETKDGIPISRQRAPRGNIAKSLPMNIPTFLAQSRNSSNEDLDDLVQDDNLDIAASIKALAKSVHGDAVFGELPRPRFSTQI
ncbi:hypothetical protein JTB14_020975 [Gonioctena quinquepunctata]|nr:hypothetical protein JTB14_020975 [Gonioctena quinquepunctata]